jgi:hypothetical protein
VAGRDRAAAEAAVVSAFADVLGRPDRRDSHRFAPVSAQLLRAARDASIEQAARIAEPAGLVSLADASDDDTLRAFDQLPERWRTVLWLDQVEHAPLSTTSLVLGTSEPSTAGLGKRAVSGLGEQLAQLKVHPELRDHCRQTTLRLAGYAARALPSRDTIRVRRHLDRCEECRARLDELDDVTPHLRGALPALPIAIESLALGAWFARAHEGAGPIGLRLPGGALAPAWLERSLAGATAAMVSLGITAAVLLNARDGGGPVPTESATARGEGEQALGDAVIDDGVDDDVVVVVTDPISTGDASSATDGSSGTVDPTFAPAGSLPRGGTSPSSPSAPRTGAPAPGPAPSPTPAPPDDPGDGTSEPSSEDPVGDVVGAVDDVVDQVCGPLATVCEVLPTEPSLPPLGL